MAANIIDDIPTLLSRISERLVELNEELVNQLDNGDGFDCTVNSIYRLFRAYEVLDQGNNTRQEMEEVANAALKELTDNQPGNANPVYPSFTLLTS